MKKSIRITTGILTTVLFGAVALNLVANDVTQLNDYVTQPEVSSTMIEDRSIETETRNSVTFYDGDDIYSDVNQGLIENELETHVAGGIDNPYNIMMSFAADTTTHNQFNVAQTLSYTGSEALWDSLEFDLGTLDITSDSIMEYFGIDGGLIINGGELTIAEYVNNIKAGFENQDEWYNAFAPEIINGDPTQTIDYEMQYDLGFGSQDGYLSYNFGSSTAEWEEFTSSSTSLETSASNFLGIWIGRDDTPFESGYTLSQPFTPKTVEMTGGYESIAPFQPYQVFRDKPVGSSGPSWLYMEEGIDFGYAKLKQIDPSTDSELGDIYSEIDIDIDVKGLRDGTITDFNGAYQILDLPIGYEYELEEVYLAYPNMTRANTYEDGSMVINGEETYSYATFKGRTPTESGEELSYSSTGDAITFATLPESFTDGGIEYTQDEFVDLINDKIMEELLDIVIDDLKLAIEIWMLQRYAEFATGELEEVLSNAFLATHLPEANNFEVIEYGSDYVTFRVDIYEGQYLDSPLGKALRNQGLTYSEELLNLYVDVKERGETAYTSGLELNFDDVTWNNNDYVNPNDLQDGDYLSQGTGDFDVSLDDGIRTHIFSISSYNLDGEKVDFQGESEFNNLKFEFFETNPYVFTPFELETNADYIEALRPDNLRLTLAQLVENALFTKYDLLTKGATISSGTSDPLFETSLYSRPLITSTFSWHDITSDTAQFSISYRANPEGEDDGEEYTTDKYFDFDEDDVIFLWNEDSSLRGEVEGGSEFEIDEAYEIGEYSDDVRNGGHLEAIDNDYVVPGDSVASNNIKTVTYELTGLKSYQQYTDFAIYLNTIESDWTLNEWSTKGEPDTSISLSDQGLYLIPSRFPLHTKRSRDYYVKILVFIIIILIILITLISLWYGWIWWKEHMSLSFYYDGEESFNRGELIFNLLHANRYPKIWEAHEEDLILVASGKVLDATFRRTSSVHNGFRISINEDTSQKLNALSILSASKYNKYYVAIRGWDDMYHTQVVSDHKAKKIMKLTEVDEFELYEQSKDSLHKEASNRTKVNLSTREKEIKIGHIVSSVSDTKTTDRTIRYQILLPHGHELEQQLLDDDGSVRFYHIYKGKAYRIEHKLIGEYGTMFEYDLINLEPSTIYVGLSVSLDGGKTIYPSASLFGMTKSVDGTNVSKTDAQLGRPKNLKVESLPIWTKNVLNEHLNKKQVETTIALIIKKHYEDENEEGFIPTSLTHQYYDDYIGKWFAKAEKEEMAKLKAEIAEKTVEVSAETKSPAKRKTTTKK